MAKAQTTEKQAPKYPHLSANFMRGQFAGQLTSAFKAKDNKDKVKDFKMAVEAGDVKIPGEITAQQGKKLETLGVALPKNVKVKTPPQANAGAGANA